VNTPTHIPQEQFELIERYLMQEMTAQERAEFNTKINDDPVLSAQVEEVKETLLGIESASLRAKLDDFHEEVNPVRKLNESETNGKVSKNFKNRFAIIAVAASIVLACGVFWFMDQGSSSDTLYAKHFTPDPGLPTTMSTTSEYNFYEAMVDYKRKEYGTAIKKWEQLLPEKPDNDTLNYFLGVANLANGDEVKAQKFLSTALNNQDGFLKSEAYYYLGLAYLKGGNTEQAKENFKLSKSERGNKILAELNN